MVVLRQITGFLLAFFVLAGSCGFTIHKHYCMGNLQKTNVFVAPEGCHEGNTHDCPFHDGKEQQKKDDKGKCCDNSVDYCKVLDDVEKQDIRYFSFVKKLSAAVFILFFENFADFSEAAYHFFEYSPPLVFRDIPVMHQSLLI